VCTGWGGKHSVRRIAKQHVRTLKRTHLETEASNSGQKQAGPGLARSGGQEEGGGGWRKRKTEEDKGGGRNKRDKEVDRFGVLSGGSLFLCPVCKPLTFYP
jgi:hypothetical protein